MWNEKPKIAVNHRIELFTWILFGIFAFLFFSLWYLSVLQSGLYQEKSERNRIRVVPLQAPRGIITDRYGKILAQDIPRFAAVLLPGSADPEKSRQTLEKIIKRKIEEPLRDRYSGEIILATQMSIEEVAMVEEARKELPGVMIEAYPKRVYPPGEDIAHIVGYVGKINSEELKRFGQTNYNNEDIIGKSGIELNYEEFLRGEKGYRKIEVDALGRIIRILDTGFPRFRHTLTLTLDMELQRYCNELLAGKSGVIIVGDPTNGELLAMANQPSFEPNLLVDGVSQDEWNELIENPQKPLTTRSLQALYPPGSIFKLIVGLAAQEANIVPRDRTIFCPGYYEYNNQRYPCWKKSGHGRLTYEDALAQSCNVTFYTLGLELGQERIIDMARRLGFEADTGIDLPWENHGFLPTSRWKRQKIGEPWYPGDTINLSIGQGYILVTPFEIFQSVVTISNRGILYTPHFLKVIQNDKGEVVERVLPKVKNRIELKPDTWERLIRGMTKVVAEGTGRACRDLPIPIAGKTGTAQNPHGNDHSWFAGFFPIERPRFVFVVLVENGGDGSGEAAHRGKDLIQWIYDHRESTLNENG